MRGFFLLLLLTNLVFITWQYSKSQEKAETVDIYHGIKRVNEGLTLLSELPPEQQPRLHGSTIEDNAAEKSGVQQEKQVAAVSGERNPLPGGEVEFAIAEKGPVAGKGSCLRITGIDSRQQMDSVLKVLREGGADKIVEGEARLKRTNYWVMLPAYPNRSKADEAASLLAAKGVKDFFIVRSGDYENAVSLGVFSSQERAERRYQQIVNLKVRVRRPRIEAIELPAKQYNVSYQIADEKTSAKLQRGIKTLNIPPAEQISCK